LAVDYIGALVASLMFPFLLIPFLSLVQSGLVMGLLNVVVAGVLMYRLGVESQQLRRGLAMAAWLLSVLLIAGFFSAERMVTFLENRMYQHEIIFKTDPVPASGHHAAWGGYPSLLKWTPSIFYCRRIPLPRDISATGSASCRTTGERYHSGGR